MNTTRREFVKKSLLVGAVALAGSEGRAEPLAPPGIPTAATSPERPAGPFGSVQDKPPYPLIPYGSGEPIYLADLQNCRPASAMSAKWQPNRWRLYDFEAEGVKGTSVTVGQNTGAPDLEYPLTQKGWYALSFGLLSKYFESRLQVRLKRDPVFTILTPNNMSEVKIDWTAIQDSRHSYTSKGIEESFWKYVELTGDETVVLRQLKVQSQAGDPDAFGNRFMPCWLAYLKLTPLTPAEVEPLTADRRRRDTRRLFATDDAFSAAAALRFRSEDDVRRQIEPYRDTDFSRLYWEAGAGDLTYFPSKVGSMITFSWMKDAFRTADRFVGESYGDFQTKGIDPFRVALEHTHAVGLEFHASYRVGGFHFPSPEDEWNAGGQYDRHPEWRSVDRQGHSGPRLSYAYPGVRNFVLSLLREVVSYPVDGIALLYNRRLPIVGYEAPLVASFQAKHGVDPKTLAEDDPRWLAHSAAVLTDFMRELRRQMRTEAARQGRGPIAITAVVMGSREENYGYGLDLEAWVREGLIDTLVPYASVKGGNSALVSWEDPKAAEWFIQLTRGTACQFAPNLMPREIAPEDYKRRAHGLYAAGVENLFFWDTFERLNFDPCWSTLRRLGHKEELAAWHDRGQPPVERPQKALSRLGDWDLSFVTPG